MLKNYVSELDLFLKDFDQKPQAHSKARAQEEAKHKRVADARDNPEAKDKSSTA